MASSAAQPSALNSWFWAARPFSLTASLAPVLVGSALAAVHVTFDWLLFAVTLTASVAIQIGTNLTDEYSDHRKHGGTGKFLAPHKVIQRGLLSERAVLVGMLVAFGYGIVGGLYIVSQAGWPILAIGVASVAAAYFYAGGPYPLGNLGLGEPVVFIFMGPIMVMGAYFVQAQEITLAGFLTSLPIAFIVTAILHCNNLRDVTEDRDAGKRSIAMLIGPRPSLWLYAALMYGAYAVIAVVTLAQVLPWFALLGLAPLPMAHKAVRKLFAATERPQFNQVMVLCAKTHGWTGIALAAGLTLAAII